MIRFRLPNKDLRNYFSVMVYNKKDSLVEGLQVPVKTSADGYYYFDYKVKRSGTFIIQISLYYYTEKETEFVGTNIVSYTLQASRSARKKT